MKTEPYVSIHCLKALSLRIVHQPSKIIFIKGPGSKLHSWAPFAEVICKNAILSKYAACRTQYVL